MKPAPSTRVYCPVCQYPLKTCLCAFVTPVASKHQIIILQHPSEVSQAKGTAKLVDLAMAQARIVVGETAADFAELKTQIEQHKEKTPCYLIYPTDSSQAVETISKPLPPGTLLLLDGSWKKSYKMLQLNPWLMQLPGLSFAAAEKTQ